MGHECPDRPLKHDHAPGTDRDAVKEPGRMGMLGVTLLAWSGVPKPLSFFFQKRRRDVVRTARSKDVDTWPSGLVAFSEGLCGDRYLASSLSEWLGGLLLWLLLAGGDSIVSTTGRDMDGLKRIIVSERAHPQGDIEKRKI